jgi:hypothetical protein
VFGLASPIRPFPSEMPQVLTTRSARPAGVDAADSRRLQLELTEFTNVVPRIRQQPVRSDPGAPHEFLVRDITP